MTSTYTRRVSFNNLYPDFIDDEDLSSSASAVGAPFKSNYAIQFNNNQESIPAYNKLDVARMYLATPVAQLPSGYSTKRKQSYKLPDPPSKSILKNKLLLQQRLFNIENSRSLGINYHEDLNDLALHPPTKVPKSELAYIVGKEGEDVFSDSDAIESDDEPEEIEQILTPRRKSYSGMTNEELMALDPQFSTTSKLSNVDQFKFDSQKTYYLPSAKKPSSTSNGTSIPKSAAGSTVYPSSNETNYKSINLTVKHPEYDSLKTQRPILTVISGRRHTWNSLDWLLNNPTNFLQDGDFLIVAALIPTKVLQMEVRKCMKKRSASQCYANGGSTTNGHHQNSSCHIYNHDIDGLLYLKCENLLRYICDKLPENLKLKITVEFVSDNTIDEKQQSVLNLKKNPVRYKFLFSRLLERYQPYLVFVGNKSSNLNFKYPIKVGRVKSTSGSIIGAPGGLNVAKLLGANGVNGGSVSGTSASTRSSTTKPKTNDQYLIKLSSYMIKYFPVPIILVGNNCKELFEIKSPSTNEIKFGNAKIMEDGVNSTEIARKDSTSSSNDSIESVVDSVEDMTAGENLLSSQVDSLFQSNSTTRFQDMIALISDTSLNDSRAYLSHMNSATSSTSNSGVSIRFDQSLITHSKIHSIYNSTKQNSNGSEPMYKVKSMIEDEPIDSKKKLEKSKSNLSATTTGSSGKEKDNEKLTTKKSPQKKTSFWKKLTKKG